MTPEIAAEAVEEVKKLNKDYPENNVFTADREDKIGSYSIVTVIVKGGRKEYINFAVVRKRKVVTAFFYINEVINYLERGLSWRALFIDQFALVIGSAALLILCFGALLVKGLHPTVQIPDAVWVAISSGIAFLIGVKGSGKPTKGRRR